MSKILIGLCAFLLLVVTPSIKADTLVITGGSLTVTGSGGGPDFTFTGDNFSITGGGEQGFSGPQSCFGCLSGSLLNVNSQFAGSSLGLGSVTINGVTLDNLIFSGSLSILGDPVTVPFATTNVTLTAPFTLSGFIFGCDFGVGPNCGASTAIFSADLVGQGIATIQLNFFQVNQNGQAQFFFNTVTYAFQSPEIPEPMTILLLTTGLIGVGAKLKFRSRGKSGDS